jgi:lysophospholipase L1-like esterase
MKTIFLNLVHVLMSPLYLIALPQGLWIKKNSIRLPEAQGPRRMTVSRTPLQQTAIDQQQSEAYLKLLYLGESPAAGVGVNNIKHAVSAQVAYTLAQSITIEWQLLAKNGIKIKELRFELQQIETLKPDICIVSMGVNDCSKLTPAKQWKAEVSGLISDLKLTGCRHIFFTAVPPMQDFPLLPAPLSWIMGYRAYVLNQVLKDICQQGEAHFLDFSGDLEPDLMSHDGYHPNKKGAELWAESISQQIIPFLETQ